MYTVLAHESFPPQKVLKVADLYQHFGAAGLDRQQRKLPRTLQLHL
jgi:hypothetical protein